MKYVKYVIFIFLVKAVCYGDAWEDYCKARKKVSNLDLSSEVLCLEAEACKITNRVTFFSQIRICGLGVRNKDLRLLSICKERFEEIGRQLPKVRKFLKAFEGIFCDNGHVLNYYAIQNHYVDILGALFFLKCVKNLNPNSRKFPIIYETYKLCLIQYDEIQ